MPPARTLSAPRKPNVKMLNVDDLQVSEFNIRMDVMEGDREEVAELVKSISEIGLQNALVVRQIPDQPGRYEVIEGSRRLRAVKEVGWKQVQCDIREFTDQEAVVASLHENLVHGEVDAAEIARGIRAYESVLGEGHSD